MSKIFRQCMPYGIRKTAEGAWEAFNRDYQPLGEAFFLQKSTNAGHSRCVSATAGNSARRLCMAV